MNDEFGGIELWAIRVDLEVAEHLMSTGRREMAIGGVRLAIRKLEAWLEYEGAGNDGVASDTSSGGRDTTSGGWY